MKLTTFIVSSTASLCILLGGCSSKPPTPSNYDASEVGKINQVIPGVILSERPVNITQRNVADNTPDNLSSPATPLDYNGSDKGVEYIIKLKATGNVISVVQAEDLHLKVNQHVLVIYGPTTRVVADQANT